MIESMFIKDITGWDMFISDTYMGKGGEVHFVKSGLYLTINGGSVAIPFSKIEKFEWMGGGRDYFELAYYDMEGNYKVLTARKVA